jgi:hypothetical protein
VTSLEKIPQHKEFSAQENGLTLALVSTMGWLSVPTKGPFNKKGGHFPKCSPGMTELGEKKSKRK